MTPPRINLAEGWPRVFHSVSESARFRRLGGSPERAPLREPMNPRTRYQATRYQAIDPLPAFRLQGTKLLTIAAVLLTAGGASGIAQQAPPYGYPQSAPQQYPQQAPPPQPQQYPQPGYGQQPAYPAPAPGQYPNQPYAPQAAQQPAPQQPPLTPDQLEQLVAPIALYPDALLAQILTASTYPDQVAAAGQWLQSMGNASPDQIAAGANSQAWDPSVQGLTAVPRVLDMMNQNQEWTGQLGDAYFNQPQDVMQTVQVLRQRAQQAGTLQNTPQQTVTQDQGAIVLAPPSPQVVYVPTYNPWSVFGPPIVPYPGFTIVGAPGFTVGVGAPLFWGPAIAIGAFSRMPFGFASWSMGWPMHGVFFRRSPYFTNSRMVADWGFPRGGPRAFAGWNRGGFRATGVRPAFGRAPVARGRGGTFNRGGSFNRGGNVNRGGFARSAPAARSGQFSRGVTTQPGRRSVAGSNRFNGRQQQVRSSARSASPARARSTSPARGGGHQAAARAPQRGGGTSKAKHH
jgi:hypothetical protein